MCDQLHTGTLKKHSNRYACMQNETPPKTYLIIERSTNLEIKNFKSVVSTIGGKNIEI